MKAASINELKKELQIKTHVELLSFCLRLARSKKENKELLTFLLFEADDIANYIENVKDEITGLLNAIHISNAYYVKKSLRKILRQANKYIRFTSSKQAEAEILIHFCNGVNNFPGALNKSRALLKMYENQIKKIEESLATLHPDLQYDLRKNLKTR